jgi:predicted metal-dependent hydrolase
MSRKWASISTTGRLTLNSELLDMPKLLGEFVIVHEVVHIIAPNHGKVFKSFMFAIYQIGKRESEGYGILRERR